MKISEQLELQLERGKRIREQAEKAIKLANYPLFRELVLEGFCRDEMARLAGVAGDPGITKDEREVAALTSQAGGHLKRFFNVMIAQADQFERDIPEIENAIAEARASEDAAEEAGFTTMGGEPAYDSEHGE